MIQRDLLFIEKHYESKSQKLPSFIPTRTADNYPVWEDFAKTMKIIEHNGVTFSIFGTADGILQHRSGKRVGLEIKSKQTTAAQTSLYSMKEPKEDHVKQCIAYSIMYGVDDYIITYVNASKKSWVMSDEDFEKNPDIRSFHIEITEKDRQSLLDDFAYIVTAAKDGNPPPLELDKWTFNNFKTACALDLSDEELTDIEAQVRAVLRSGIPNWKKQQYADAIEFIRETRKTV